MSASSSDSVASQVLHSPGIADRGNGNGHVAAPTISIVIPAYNVARFLETTVASVQNQTLRDWELIIVDDGSNDRTAQVAETLAQNDPRVRFVHQKNSGVSHARNTGVKLANPLSEFIAFIDGDDLWFPETLQTLYSTIHDHPESPAVYGLGQYIDMNGTVIGDEALEKWARERLEVKGSRRVRLATNGPTPVTSLFVRNYIPIGAILIRHSQYEKLGGFNTGLIGMEDWHLWVRLGMQGPLGFVDRVVMQYRRHDSNASSNIKRMKIEQFVAARDLFRSGIFKTEEMQRTFLRSQPAVCHMLWAGDHLAHGRFLSAIHHLWLAGQNAVDFHLKPRLSPNAPTKV